MFDHCGVTVIEACLVTKGATLEACLVKEGIALNDNTGVTENSGTESKNSSTETTFSRSEKESNSSEGNAADADIGPSYDSNMVTGVPHDMFENVFAYEIQSHEQPQSIPDTYETQFEETPKVPMNRRNVYLKNHLVQIQNWKEHLEQAQLRDHDTNLWNNLLMKYFCYVKQAMIKSEKQTFSKLQLSQDSRLNFEQSYEHNVNTRVRNRLSDEFEPLVKNVNLQLNCFEKSLVKEMKNDLKATALDFHNKSWQESFAEGTRCKPDNFRSLVLLYMEELDKIIDERVLKNEEVRMKEKEVQAIKEIEKRLKEIELQQQESLVIESTTLEANLCTDNTVMEACLVTEGETLEACLVKEGIALNDNTGVTENSGTESKGILNLH
ncbi:hypothetical protein Tco_0554286 [Tanacetum coccineum]